MKKILEAQDIDDIKIIEVINTKEDYTEDIIIELPEKYGIKPISFMETGLINAVPEVIGYTDNKIQIPKVLMSFYGKFEHKFV